MLHLVGCLYYLYQWCTVKQISDNEIYLLMKYIKSVLWRVAKSLSYIEDPRCLKLNNPAPNLERSIFHTGSKGKVLLLRILDNLYWFLNASVWNTSDNRPSLISATFLGIQQSVYPPYPTPHSKEYYRNFGLLNRLRSLLTSYSKTNRFENITR